MINITQSKKEDPTYTKGPISKIGETGGTVVYIFPGGKACVKKGEKNQTSSSSARPSDKQTPKHAIKETEKGHKTLKRNPLNSSKDPQTSTQTNIQKVGDRLVQAGVINSTQLQVALYDQKAMKLRLGDVLIARGWTDQATLDSVLSN